nr:hypothetical protein [Tanacetum cinerariifolium]
MMLHFTVTARIIGKTWGTILVGISFLLAVANNLQWQWELILPVGTLTWQWECLVHFIPNISNKTAKDLWDALARHMLGSEYGEQDRKAVVLYEYETFKATEGELLLDTYIRYLQVINDLKKCGYSKDNYVNDAMGSKEKTVVVTSDPLALIAEKTNVSKSKAKVVVSSDSKGSEADDFSELKKITALLAKAFNRRKFYSKPTNNNLRTSSSSQSANKKQELSRPITRDLKER